MAKPDIDAAEQYLAANARVLERRHFERVFRGGGPLPVRDAVAAYRNPDGGFGHALEPDGRCPGSQPIAVEFGLRALHEADAWDDGLAQGACGWLAAHAPAAGGAVFVDPSIAGWPHAPWWVPEDGAPPSLISTGLLAGTLHARGVEHPWLDRATAVLWSRIDSLTSVGPYDMRGVLGSAYPLAARLVHQKPPRHKERVVIVRATKTRFRAPSWPAGYRLSSLPREDGVRHA
jgi:hypothetical protein